MFWVFIWLLLSAFVLGAFFWSVRILLQQKQAWKAYATKLGLTYDDGGRFLGSPSVTGVVGRFRINLFTERQVTADARGERFMTALEIVIPETMPMMGAVCTKGMTDIVDQLRMINMSVPAAQKDWSADWRMSSNAPDLMTRYMTAERYDTIGKIFRMKLLSALFVFDRQEAVLRVETADPLQNAERLDKIVKSLSAQVESLALSAAERDSLFKIAPPAAPQPAVENKTESPDQA